MTDATQQLTPDTTTNPITLALRWLFSQTSTNVMLIATQVGIAYGAFWVARDLIPQTFQSIQGHYDKIEDRHEKQIQKQVDADKQRFDDWRQLLHDIQEGKVADPKNKSAAIFEPMPKHMN